MCPQAAAGSIPASTTYFVKPAIKLVLVRKYLCGFIWVAVIPLAYYHALVTTCAVNDIRDKTKRRDPVS